jgi:hypothetical protein
MLPKVKENYFTERDGVIAVSQIVNRMKCVWRETPIKDIGIDGQIEYVNSNNEADGHIVAVQVKSGTSYITRNDDFIKVDVEEKHRDYWERFPLPVILIVYDPVRQEAYWQDARQILRSGIVAVINVPKANILRRESKLEIFRNCGALGYEFLDEDEVVRQLILNKHNKPGFPISFFDIFVNGLTDIGDKVFFSMGLCKEIADFNVFRNGNRYVNIADAEFGFIDKYIDFIVSQSLIVFDYSIYRMDCDKRMLVSTFIAPLTARGKSILLKIREMTTPVSGRELTEQFVEMNYMDGFDERLEANRAVLIQLSEKLLNKV